MREPQLAEELDRGRAVGGDRAAAHRERGPFADSVGGEDGGIARGRTEEGGGGVRSMVLGEEDPVAAHAELGGDDPLDPELAAERVLHRLREGGPGSREAAERQGEDALELEHRLFVEDDGVELLGLHAGEVEAPLDRGERKGSVVLAPREPLLLHGTDGHAVDEQRRRRVVVVRGDAEDAQTAHRPCL